ncbi:MAG TPA: CGNR zinc finger domain-containing protein [Candidatus Dormibacteraeota bacterium]|nr:CGNR zinc finger domain-containing protein [Candidatus Dormibacteraeota bacterium]
MNFESYSDRGVLIAVALVNALTPGEAGGRPVALPAEGAGRAQLAEQAEARVTGRRARLDPAVAEGLYRIAGQIRRVFQAAARGDEDGAARRLNTLLREYHAAPQLSHHGGQRWHLHFHSPGAGHAVGQAVSCATALAAIVGTHGAGRLGVCAAERCDRVYVDTSRNGSRRFCGPACLNRTKMAVFRARQAGRPPAER